MNTKANFVFRRANAEDCKAVLQMIQELADYLNMSNGPKNQVEDLVRDSGLNGGPEYCHIYILLLKKDDTAELLPAGYSICYFCYSTWEGPSYFMEDIYVKPEYRGIGGGARIFCEIAAKAKEYGCPRVDFHVNEWNEARTFYEKMGAIDLTELEQWHLHRVPKKQINELAAQLARS